MKSFLPWLCIVAASGAQVIHAADGLAAYRQGNYAIAAKYLPALSSKDPVANYYLGLMYLYGYGQLKNTTLALRYLTQAADKGHVESQLILAKYYLNRANDPELAFKWFKKAADFNDVPAETYVAAAYLFGYGVKKNADMAKNYYIKAAKHGNPIAEYALGVEFLADKNSQNKKMGLIWLTRAASHGDSKAQFKLGELYLSGKGVPQDGAKARELFESAAAQDDCAAMVALGEMASRDNSPKIAEHWFSKAADLKYVPAQIALGLQLLDSTHTPAENQAGFLMILPLAQAGSTEAELALSTLYKEGRGVLKDDSLAAEWQQKALSAANMSHPSLSPKVLVANWLTHDQQNGFSKGDYQLGGIFSDWYNLQALQDNNYNQAPQIDVLTRKELYNPQFKLVKPKDIPLSDLIDTLVVLNSADAMSNAWFFPHYELNKRINIWLREDSYVLEHQSTNPLLTSYLDTPDIKPFDYVEEKMQGWEHQAELQLVLTQLYNQAILGDSNAQFELGQLYQYGIGVSKNSAQAITWYQLAAIQQDIRAEYNLGILYLEGQTTPVDEKKGVEWMSDAAFKGNAFAQYVMAHFYEVGLTRSNGEVLIAANHDQAIAMYSLASANHFGDAEYRLASYLMREQKSDLSETAREHRSALIQRLYQGAVDNKVAEAFVPLAFYHVMDNNPSKQQEAFKIAEQEAQAGNVGASVLLGIMYERGIAVTADQATALYWYQQPGKNPIKSFILGTKYSSGEDGLSQDVQKGREWLQWAADAGFSYANFNLAILQHQNGDDFIPQLNRARLLGNSKAGLLLADYYLLSANNPDNMKQAGDIYRYFAEKGDKDAQTKLGFLYDRGLAGETNYEQARQWYSLAAEQGQPVAQYLLGSLYQLGRIEKAPNQLEAKKWFEAAQTTYPKASVALGFINETVNNDYVMAAKNYQSAADMGDAVAEFNLGLIYDNGKGTPVDGQTARSFYMKAAKQGHTRAMTQLAQLYFKGIGGAKNLPQALYWYKKAAQLGDSGAMYQLGLLSESGVATKLDLTHAMAYYQQASDLGNEKAKLALARMYQYGLGVDKDYQHAAELYKGLAESGVAYAQYQLGLMYLEGRLGVPQLESGKLLLKQASENGSKLAQIRFQRLNAQEAPKFSFVEPVMANPASIVAEKSADLMYFDALSEWNRGDEVLSKMILNRLVTEYPNYMPAKQVYEQIGTL